MSQFGETDEATEHIVITEKSKWFAAGSNVLIPGLGYFYMSRRNSTFDLSSRGWGAIAIWILGGLTAIIGIGVLIIIGLWIYVVYDCFTSMEEAQIEAKLNGAETSITSG